MYKLLDGKKIYEKEEVDLITAGIETKADDALNKAEEVNSLAQEAKNIAEASKQELTEGLATVNEKFDASKASTDAALAAVNDIRDTVSQALVNSSDAVLLANEAKTTAYTAKTTAEGLSDKIDTAVVNAEEALQKVKGAVFSVNNNMPDENGNVNIPEPEGIVKSVNNNMPDENGNVNIPEPEGIVKSVNSITPDENGNVNIPEPVTLDTIRNYIGSTLLGRHWLQSDKKDNSFYTVYYANGVWVACSYSNTGLWYSTDGQHWLRSDKKDNDFRTVYYANGVDRSTIGRHCKHPDRMTLLELKTIIKMAKVPKEVVLEFLYEGR